MQPPLELLTFHPNDGKVVFLQLGNYIVLCNMQTRVLKVLSQLRDGGKILPGNSGYDVSVYTKSIFLLTQSSWTTPVPLPFHWSNWGWTFWFVSEEVKLGWNTFKLVLYGTLFIVNYIWILNPHPLSKSILCKLLDPHLDCKFFSCLPWRSWMLSYL